MKPLPKSVFVAMYYTPFPITATEIEPYETKPFFSVVDNPESGAITGKNVSVGVYELVKTLTVKSTVSVE